jgi:hypothetical protein
MRCFYYLEALIWFSPLMVYLGWLGACSQHVWLIQSRHKPLWSFSFWLLMPLYASLNDVSLLCMIMAVIALLVGRSQSFASPHFVLSMSSTCASNSQKPSYSNVSTINSYAWYLQAIPSKFSCATFQKNPSKYFSFCDTVFSSWGRSGRICYLPYCLFQK